MKFLGAILVHPVRRQNFTGKLHIRGRLSTLRGKGGDPPGLVEPLCAEGLVSHFCCNHCVCIPIFSPSKSTEKPIFLLFCVYNPLLATSYLLFIYVYDPFFATLYLLSYDEVINGTGVYRRGGPHHRHAV